MDIPRVEYEDQGRGGNIIYKRKDITLKFWWEYVIGEAHVFIDIPSKDKWVKVTNTPLSDRKEILIFIANRVARDKAAGLRYKIGELAITFYRNS